MQKKKFWQSKTLWVNIIAGVSMLIEITTGAGLNLAIQAEILVVVNLILRLVTKTGIGK